MDFEFHSATYHSIPATHQTSKCIPGINDFDLLIGSG